MYNEVSVQPFIVQCNFINFPVNGTVGFWCKIKFDNLKKKKKKKKYKKKNKLIKGEIYTKKNFKNKKKKKKFI